MEDDLSARLEAFLETGITTVMSTGDFWPRIREVKEAMESGKLLGPSSSSCSPARRRWTGYRALGIEP